MRGQLARALLSAVRAGEEFLEELEEELVRNKERQYPLQYKRDGRGLVKEL